MSSVTALKLIKTEFNREFEQAFREHARMVYRAAYCVTRNPQDAEDVVQALFLGLLRRGFSPGMKHNLPGYLYRSAVNLSLNTVRLRGRHVPLTELTCERLSDTAGDAAQVQDCDLKTRLAEAMAQLNPSDVELLILRYEFDYSDAQIAKLLSKSRGAVAVTLYRARRRLKRLLIPSEQSHEEK
jgi:RNA polymerase sigma-70 factor, ECF subfamily